MKQFFIERKFKKMALYFAKIFYYDKVVRLKSWKGCPIFEPRYKSAEKQSDMPPMIIVIRNGATYTLPAEETVEYLQACYPESATA